MSIESLDFLRDYEKVLLPILTFVLGFAASRFTMTLNEKRQYELKLFENGKEWRFQVRSATLDLMN